MLYRAYHRNYNGKKAFTCIQCPKTFPYVSELKNHIKSHTGEKPLTCEQCHKTFSQVGDLKNHMGTDTGEKPFHENNVPKHFHSHLICGNWGEINSKTFTQVGELKNHLKAMIL